MVPSHCGLSGNKKADALAKQAAELPQDNVPVDVRTVYRAAARAAARRVASQRPAGWFRTLMGTRPVPPVIGLDRRTAVDVHQLRAGHWSCSAQYLHRIGRNPVLTTRPPFAVCERCEETDCPGNQCPLCREEPDGPGHVLLRCPALMSLRFNRTGAISLSLEEARRTEYVAAMGAAFRWLVGREAPQR